MTLQLYPCSQTHWLIQVYQFKFIFVVTSQITYI